MKKLILLTAFLATLSKTCAATDNNIFASFVDSQMEIINSTEVSNSEKIEATKVLAMLKGSAELVESVLRDIVNSSGVSSHDLIQAGLVIKELSFLFETTINIELVSGIVVKILDDNAITIPQLLDVFNVAVAIENTEILRSILEGAKKVSEIMPEDIQAFWLVSFATRARDLGQNDYAIYFLNKGFSAGGVGDRRMSKGEINIAKYLAEALGDESLVLMAERLLTEDGL